MLTKYVQGSMPQSMLFKDKIVRKSREETDGKAKYETSFAKSWFTF